MLPSNFPAHRNHAIDCRYCILIDSCDVQRCKLQLVNESSSMANWNRMRSTGAPERNLKDLAEKCTLIGQRNPKEFSGYIEPSAQIVMQPLFMPSNMSEFVRIFKDALKTLWPSMWLIRGCFQLEKYGSHDAGASHVGWQVATFPATR